MVVGSLRFVLVSVCVADDPNQLDLPLDLEDTGSIEHRGSSRKVADVVPSGMTNSYTPILGRPRDTHFLFCPETRL